VTLADLFDGRRRLFIKHFMFGPGQTTQCVGCSLEVDHIEGILVHLQNHDVSYVAVARAPIEEIEVMRKRMGLRCSRQGIRNDVGTVPRVSRKQDPHATAYDTRRDG
jgi:predicted dithiol-disulfide oxidoreductase (DUF899 family)